MRRPLLLAPLAFLALGVLLDGCSLRDVKYDNCTSDAECATAFGPGSTCSGGFCSPAASCTTGADCRKAAGWGACVGGACVSTLPTDPAVDSTYTEPADLSFSAPDGGSTPPLIIGGIFSLNAAHDQALTTPIRLAVREINANGGLNNGQQLGVIFCDNGGPMDTASGAARAALNVHCLDYLAGTLGVPYVVGPLTSADSLTLIGELTAKAYPTVLISPSATSPALTTTNATISPHKQRMFWRTCPNDALQAQVLAKNVIGSVMPVITSVSVVFIQDTYGTNFEQAFAANFSPMGSTNKTNLAPYPDTSASSLMGVVSAVTTQNSDAVVVIAEQGAVAAQIVTALVNGVPGIATKPFFFTDGSKDTSLIDPNLPANVAAVIAKAQGTAPAPAPDPTAMSYTLFLADLTTDFHLTSAQTQVSFLAQAYDATYVGAYGVVYGSKSGNGYDGFDVATGLGLLESGTSIQIGSPQWPNGKGDLVNQGGIKIQGLSGPLQFDPTTGEAPGPIEWWKVTGTAPNLAYAPVSVIQPM
jgi:ABC-type branched-subunit amino acid transport system substrate-binding protein